MTDLSLTVERTISAPQAVVFNAWLDPKLLMQFMMPGPDRPCSKAEADPRQGGRFALEMQSTDSTVPIGGTYTEVVPHSRLAFTWEGPFSAEGTLVTLTFAPVAGGTHVTLVQQKFVSEDSRDNHTGGWGHILAALAQTLEG